MAITDDTLDENDETVSLTLSAPTGGATLGAQSTATLTITDNDNSPTVQFAAASSSGTESTTPAVIAANLSTASGLTVTVNSATANGTATAGADYTSTSGTLTFSPGVTTQNINVPITNDTAVEGDETFTVTLSAPSNATLGATTVHTGTITYDDAPAAVSALNPWTNVYGATATTQSIDVTSSAFTVSAVTNRILLVAVQSEISNDLEVKEVRALEMVVQVDLRLLNPNDVPIEVKGMDCELSLNGQDVAFGVSKTDTQVPPFGTEVIPITFYSSFLDLARSFIDLERNKTLKLEISGRVHLGNGFLVPSVIPFRTERELSFDDLYPRRR